MEDGQLSSTQKVGLFPWCFSLRSYLDKFKANAMELAKKVKKIGKDDPRRIVHSFKVGLALTLVSIFYYVTPLFTSLGVSALWAVMTVVVVMEYTVGGTLSKGVNRAVATLVGGALGLGAHHIATLCGDKGEPIVLGIFVFLIAAMTTYSRFIPGMKARYDYGMLIFILTFSLVTVSSYRDDELTQLAQQRLSTIALGVAICLFSSIFVFPVWAGEDLHHLVAANLEKLASFLEGIGEEYFGEKMGIEAVESMSFLRDYKSVLNSKPIEDSLANFAQWEPGHGRFGFRHPWRQYLKIGALSRQCAYSMEVLQNFIITSTKTKLSLGLTVGHPLDKQATTDPELGFKIRSACIDMSIGSGNILRELASEIHTMTVSSTTSAHIDAAIAATIKVKIALSEEARAVPAVLESAIAASLLADIVQFVHLIAISTQELARLAHFKSLEPIHRATVKAVDGEGPGPEVIIVAEE